MSAVKVILIGVNVEASAFADFCRHDLLDFAVTEKELNCLLLSNSQEASSLPGVDTLLGQWPRVFDRLIELRDTLYELVEPHLALNSNNSVSIILLANQPSNLNAEQILTPIREQLKSRELTSQRLWYIGLALSGAMHETNTIKELLVGNQPILHTVCLLGSDADTPSTSLMLPQFMQIRAIIDLSADYDQGWKEFRYQQGSQIPRLWWIAPLNASRNNCMQSIVSYLKGATFGLWSKDEENSKPDQFETTIDEQIKSVEPGQDHPDGHNDRDSDKTSVKLRKEGFFLQTARTNLQDFKTQFRNQATASHDRWLKRVRETIETEDSSRRQVLEEMDDKIRTIALPAGGLSDEARDLVGKKNDEISETKRKWESEIETHRNEFHNAHKTLQNRQDPTLNGALSETIFLQGGAFYQLEAEADAAVNRLSTNWQSLVALAVSPLILTALTWFFWDSFALSFNDVMDWTLESEVHMLVSGIIVAIALFPAFVTFASFFYHRRNLKKALEDLDNEATSFFDFIRDAMSGAQKYSNYARSVLFANELARMVKRRLANSSLDKVNQESESFFFSSQKEQLKEEEMKQVHDIVSTLKPETWLRKLAQRQIESIESSGNWEFAVTAEDTGRNVTIDRDSIKESKLSLRSLFLVPSSIEVKIRPILADFSKENEVNS